MPELPDLEVFSHNLTKRLKNKVIAKIDVTSSKTLNVSAAALNKKLKGSKIKSVERHGKQLHIVTSDGDVLALHLMLHGTLSFSDEPAQIKHSIIQLLFEDNSSLTMADYQGRATPTLNPGTNDTPDALDKNINAAYLSKLLASKRTKIKALLLDQHLIRGIGNAYADEILWEARISPFSTASKIPGDKVTALAKAIKSILNKAIKSIRKNHPQIISGEIRDFLVIHNSHKNKSPTGAAILQKAAGGRKTYYTEEQEVYK